MRIDEELLSFVDNVYRTTRNEIPWVSKAFPTFTFYRKFLCNLVRSSMRAKRGRYGDLEWSQTSCEVLRSLESVGVRLELTGVEHVRRLDVPCVFVANHMSMFETMVLPAIIHPIRPVTFVVKESLFRYPLFHNVLRASQPIAVSRENAKQDYKAVMREGVRRLEQGISVVVFPQTTRSLTFSASEFNTIGVKLASKASVPVMPIALRTDAWGNGKWFKDLGPIDPTKRVNMEFGEPISIVGRGASQHAEVIRYIDERLSCWRDAS